MILSQIITSIISALATVVIAIVTWQNYRLIKIINKKEEEYKLALREKDEEYRSHIKDLYQAIVISNLLSGPSSYGSLGQAIDAFKSQYKGKVKIFD